MNCLEAGRTRVQIPPAGNCRSSGWLELQNPEMAVQLRSVASCCCGPTVGRWDLINRNGGVEVMVKLTQAILIAVVLSGCLYEPVKPRVKPTPTVSARACLEINGADIATTFRTAADALERGEPSRDVSAAMKGPLQKSYAESWLPVLSEIDDVRAADESPEDARMEANREQAKRFRAFADEIDRTRKAGGK